MQLDLPVTSIDGIGEELSKKLKKLGITTVYDLLHHIPSRYADYSKISNFNDLKLNEPITIEGQIISLKNIFTKSGKAMQEGVLSNGEDTITVVWFNQTFLTRTLKIGTNVALTGKVSFWGKKKALFAPQYEIIRDGAPRIHSGKIVAIYPETAGITSKWIRRIVYSALELQVEEHIPKEKLSQIGLLGFNESLKTIHEPNTIDDIEKARERLAFDELLKHSLSQIERRNNWKKNTASKKFLVKKSKINSFFEKLPFNLTISQKRSIEEILQDLSCDIPMNRLLEGDVGSGKTIVAATALFVSYLCGAPGILMAPTQLLAEQHFKSLTNILSPFGIPVKLITARQKNSNLSEKAIYVGTHALLYKYPNKDIGLIVIDEQHRFGVHQRALLSELLEKSNLIPHTLTMTATPIPRTIALTLYGDLDISTLDELPSGRKSIKTWVIPPPKRDDAYVWIENEIKKNGSQAFVVCPLIDESESETMKEVKVAKTEYLRLKKIFKSLKVELLHGKMKANEKTQRLSDFRDKKIDILVTTPVVEVGIDIPNATIMMIESADRFGLAALHQLRGRVGRGEKQSYCLLFTDNKSQKVLQKLKAMSKTESGRALAELDLSMRGPGEIFGTKQSGLPELKIARWTDIELIKKAKKTAEEISQTPEQYIELINYYRKRQVAPN